MDTLDRGGDVEALIRWDEADEDELDDFLDELFGDEEKREAARERAVERAPELVELLDDPALADDPDDELLDDLLDLLFPESPGGHAAMVTRIVQLAAGSFVVTYLDDPEQGDGEAENEEITVLVQPDGTFPGGKIEKLLIENVGV